MAARTRRANESTTVHKKTKRVNKKKMKKIEKKKKKKKKKKKLKKKKKKSKKNKRLSTPRIRSGNQSVESAGKRNAGRRAPKWQRFRVAASYRVGSCSKRTRHQQVLFLFFLSFSVCVSSSSTSVIITLTFHFFFYKFFFCCSPLYLSLCFFLDRKPKLRSLIWFVFAVVFIFGFLK